MYHNRILCVIFTLILAVGITIHAAEATESITIETSNDVYYSGDFVVVFGKVQTIFENTPITIQILNQGNLIGIAQIKVAQDGTFVTSFNASGPLWTNDGTYQVSVAYASATTQTTFEFFRQSIDKSSASFPVNIPNSGSFDAQKSDGVDGSFIILIGKENSEPKNFTQVEYEEIGTGTDYRTIRIQLEKDDKLVDIIGTYIIPEFGSIVIIILVVAISSTIIISKSRFSVRYN